MIQIYDSKDWTDKQLVNIANIENGIVDFYPKNTPNQLQAIFNNFEIINFLISPKQIIKK